MTSELISREAAVRVAERRYRKKPVVIEASPSPSTPTKREKHTAAPWGIVRESLVGNKRARKGGRK